MILALLGVLGCGSTRCANPSEPLVSAEGVEISCGQGEDVVSYVRLLAGRPVPAASRERLLDALASDPAVVAERVEAARADRRRIVDLTPGLAQGAARSVALGAMLAGQGPWAGDDGAWASLVGHVAAVWGRHADGMVLVEADIEGFLHLASLGREIQGAGPLRLSVSDRSGFYGEVVARFEHGTRADREALVSIGPVWTNARAAWQAAPYEQQQLFARVAPLPPPMTANSLGYARAVLAGDVPALVRALHQGLGPLPLEE